MMMPDWIREVICLRLWELLVLAVGLSMDAFAVSVCKGLALRRVTLKECLTAGVWFGAFQALMPLLGFFLGATFAEKITAVDHWIAFVLLGLIGANMIRESFGEAEGVSSAMTPGAMLPLAVATSIDALAVGVTFALLTIRIIPAVATIGVITCALSALGVKLGSVFGARWRSRAELAGGIILVLLGTKILLEHLGIL